MHKEQFPLSSVAPFPSARNQRAKIIAFCCCRCFCIVRSFDEEDFLEYSHPVLFCLIRKRSFEPFVCFWVLFARDRALLLVSVIRFKCSHWLYC